MKESLFCQQTRDGLRAVTLVCILYFLFLLLAMVMARDFHPAVFLNRAFFFSLFVWVRHRLESGRLNPDHYHWWSLFLAACGLASLSISYACGAVTHIAARLGVLIVFGGLVSAPRSFYLIFQAACMGLCAFLQTCFPSSTDPGLNLAIPTVALFVGNSVFNARVQTEQVLYGRRQELEQQGRLLEETLEEARQLQLNLDADVVRATRDLEVTNRELQRAIDEQIATFDINQGLHRQMAEALCDRLIGKAAGAAAHDFNNLLAVVACSLELLEEEMGRPAAPEREAVLALLNAEVDRSTQVGREILAVSGRQILRSQRLPLPDWLDSLLARAGQEFGPRYHWRNLSCGLKGFLIGDEQQLNLAVLAVLRNATEAMPAGGTIEVRADLTGEVLQLWIRDNGPGLTAVARERLFEPFFTTRSARSHSGLGLAAGRAILRQHGGDLIYCERPSPGATFRVDLRWEAS